MNVAAPTNRIYGLDILRAAAILFVLQIHSLKYISPHADTHYYWLFILDGVDIFFVLSGFLIGGILLKAINNNGLDWQALKSFWIRRWFRTLPNYFLLLVVLLAGYFYLFNEFPPKALQFFVFLQNFADPHPTRFFPESWSLAVEEWFYIIIPLGLFFLLKKANNKKRVVFSWICFVIIAVSIFRIHRASTLHYNELNTWDQYIRKQVLTRLDSIMYGFLGAYFSYYRFAFWTKWKNGLFIAGLITLFGSRYIYSESVIYAKYFYIIVQSAGTLLLLPKLQSIVNGKGVVYKMITHISIISYSIYLLNYTVVLHVILPETSRMIGVDYTKSVRDAVITYCLFWIITFILSWCLYRFFEKPMMNLREKFAGKTGRR